MLTQPYQDALLSAHNKLIDVMVNEGCAWLNGQSGTFIMGRKSYVFNVHHDGRMETAMYIDGDKCFSVEYEDGQWTAYSTRHWQYQEKDQEMAIWTVSICLAFEKYAELETKQLPPNSRVVDITCKYINQTDVPVTVMDSRWFTTVVKSDAFKVSGHFRLQPCGERNTDRKLIWVSDFMKTGYTAPARKLSATV